MSGRQIRALQSRLTERLANGTAPCSMTITSTIQSVQKLQTSQSVEIFTASNCLLVTFRRFEWSASLPRFRNQYFFARMYSQQLSRRSVDTRDVRGAVLTAVRCGGGEQNGLAVRCGAVKKDQ